MIDLRAAHATFRISHWIVLNEENFLLTLDHSQPDLFEGWIAPELLVLPEELVFADEAIGDERVLEPFLKQATLKGRPSTAVAMYLRMMYLLNLSRSWPHLFRPPEFT